MLKPLILLRDNQQSQIIPQPNTSQVTDFNVTVDVQKLSIHIDSNFPNFESTIASNYFTIPINNFSNSDERCLIIYLALILIILQFQISLIL
jgi:hypothetical protein